VDPPVLETVRYRPVLEMHRKLVDENTHLVGADPVQGVDGAWYHRGYIDSADGATSSVLARIS